MQTMLFWTVIGAALLAVTAVRRWLPRARRDDAAFVPFFVIAAIITACSAFLYGASHEWSGAAGAAVLAAGYAFAAWRGQTRFERSLTQD